MRTLAPILIAVIAMTFLILTDTGKLLGAHPWWSQKTLIIGAPIGILLASLTGLLGRHGFMTLLFAALTAVAFWIASSGKAGFAASYAEDAFAGKLWFYGWIATGAALAALFTAASHSILTKRGS